MKKKTHKMTVKRFKVSGQGKFMKRTAGQNHFNSRESGVVTRRKRRDISIAETESRIIHQLMPYN